MTTISTPLSDPRASPPAPTSGPNIASTSMTRTARAAQPQPQAGNLANAASAELAAARQVTVDLPEITAGELHLSVDEATGRVIGQVVDRNSGELLWQVPSDDMLRLIAATKKFLGPIYSTEA